jgi:hypothetical protein
MSYTVGTDLVRYKTQTWPFENAHTVYFSLFSKKNKLGPNWPNSRKNQWTIENCWLIIHSHAERNIFCSSCGVSAFDPQTCARSSIYSCVVHIYTAVLEHEYLVTQSKQLDGVYVLKKALEECDNSTSHRVTKTWDGISAIWSECRLDEVKRYLNWSDHVTARFLRHIRLRRRDLFECPLLRAQSRRHIRWTLVVCVYDCPKKKITENTLILEKQTCSIILLLDVTYIQL